MINPFLYYSLS